MTAYFNRASAPKSPRDQAVVRKAGKHFAKVRSGVRDLLDMLSELHSPIDDTSVFLLRELEFCCSALNSLMTA